MAGGDGREAAKDSRTRGEQPTSYPGVDAWTAAWADDPLFPGAARRLAANLLAASEEDERLGAVFKDAGRYLTALFAAFLDGSGGLTQAALKQICGASGYVSPGRARALIEFLVHLGYLEEEMEAWRATPTFLAAWRRHSQAALEAAAMLAPETRPLIARLHDPESFQLFLRIQAQRLFSASSATTERPALMRVFVEHYAGSQILWTLLVQGTEPDFPWQGWADISMSGYAARFDVSRMHVQRLIEAAVREGLLDHEGRRVRATALFRDTVRPFYAFQLAELNATAAATLAALPACIVDPCTSARSQAMA
jgi:hypothetical protein